MLILLISTTFSEAILKGGNRRSIENQTIMNLRVALLPYGKFDIKKKASRILISCDKFDRETVKDAVLKVFGIDYVSFPVSVPSDIKEIENSVLLHSPELSGHKIKVETKRADKSFPMTSQEVNACIGKILVDNGCTVDLKNPEKTIFIDILPTETLICFDKFKGFGGCPVGSSGKVLSLLSGGIDSPVSSLLMMKRGCIVDYLHIHQFQENKQVLDSKIMKIIKKLKEYSQTKHKLFIIPYTEFYKATLKINPKLELVIFRRFLLNISNELARKYRYKGVVTGDSLGQVASQTIDNLFTTDEAAQLPVYRPLISFNKQEIVNLSRKFGSYSLSIEPYKDCCSLVAHKSPDTKVWLQTAKDIEKEINIEKIVKKTLEQMEIVEV